MKKILLMLSLFSHLFVKAQEKVNPVSFQAGFTTSTTATYHIIDTDTSFKNTFTIAPFLRIMHRSGFGLNYSLNGIASDSGNNIFMHTASAFYEEYDKPVNLNFRYTHFFFTNNNAVPYTPISNELYGYVAYKKLWLAPVMAASFGFGQDENKQQQSGLNVAAGFTHNFNFSNKTLQADIAPSVFINAGNDMFYSFVRTARYNTQGNGSKNFLKNQSHGRGNSNRGNGTTVTTSTANNQFTFNNAELNVYSSFTIGHFEIVPDMSVYVPLNTNNDFSFYWQLKLGYNVGKL